VYAEEARHRREWVQRVLYRASIDHVFVPTNARPAEPLLDLFAKRMRR
jgi:hypothetical protein